MAGGRGPVTPVESIQGEIERARIAWAQACIDVVLLGEIIIEPAPKDSLGKDILDDQGEFTIDGVDFNKPADDKAVVGSLQGVTEGVAEVIFAGWMPDHGGWTKMPLVNENYDESVRGNTYIFINRNEPIERRTLAHEIGHALTNTGEAAVPRYIFFPDGSVQDVTVEFYRRIRHDTEEKARTWRDEQDYQAVGNHLLQALE